MSAVLTHREIYFKAGRMRSRLHAGGPMAVRQFPDIGLQIAAAGVGPENIRGAFAIEVADA
jgi:hypothetical protein